MIADLINDKPALFTLIGGLVLLYIASQAALDALLGKDLSSPGKRAISYWIPIAVTSFAACFFGRNDIAIAVLFSTSVTSLALGIGSTLWLAPALHVPAVWRRLWMFLPPTAILAFLCGFAGTFSWRHAAYFFVQGIAMLSLWISRQAADGPVATQVVDTRSRTSRVIELILASILAIPGAWLVIHAATHTSENVRVLSGVVIAAVVLGPGLMLPAIGAGTTLASEGKSAESITANIALVLLNLCLTLPLVIVFNYVVPVFHALLSHNRSTTTPANFLESIVDRAKPMAFPITVWRVDNVILIILGMLLIPVGAGRWVLGRREGIAMVIGYAAYLLIVVALAARA